MQFAKDITLGSAIASMIDPLARRYVVPIVDQILTADLKKWSVSLVEYFIYFCCISMAWFIHSIITACHCSIRGGLMFSRNIMNYLNDMDILKLNHKETLLDEYIGYGMFKYLINCLYLTYLLLHCSNGDHGIFVSSQL